MHHRYKPLQRATEHTLRRRIGREQLGVARLQVLQFTEQTVVLGVRDLRLVEFVVAPGVVRDEPAQFLQPSAKGWIVGHGRTRAQLNKRCAAVLPAGRSRKARASYRRWSS